MAGHDAERMWAVGNACVKFDSIPRPDRWWTDRWLCVAVCGCAWLCVAVRGWLCVCWVVLQTCCSPRTAGSGSSSGRPMYSKAGVAWSGSTRSTTTFTTRPCVGGRGGAKNG